MPIKSKIDTASEFFLCLLVFGVTFSNAIAEICISALIALFIAGKIINKDIRLPKTPLNLILYIFCAIAVISFLRNPSYKQTFRGSLKVVKYALLYFSIVDFLRIDLKRLMRLFWLIIFISAFTYINGIIQNITGFDLLRQRTLIPQDCLRRISASFIHPNDFAGYIISALPLTLCFLFNPLSKRKKIILSAVCLLGFYCLLRTSSRGAWIGFGVAMFVYFFMYKKRLSYIIPFAILFCIVISPYGLQRVLDVFTIEQNSGWERIKLWQGTWNMIKEHPILGFGINTFSVYFPAYRPPDYSEARYAHNSYLQMWAEIGLAGLACFLYLIFKVIKNSGRKIKQKLKNGPPGFINLGLLTGYIGFLIQSGLDTNLYSLVLLTQFWLITAYLVSLNIHLESSIKEE